MFTKRPLLSVILLSLVSLTSFSRASTVPFVGTGSLVTARFFHTATLLTNGTVLVTGGSDGSTYLTSAELYNPSNGTWTATGSMTDARGQHTATLLPNGKVLVAGGWGNSTRWLASAEIYDPSTGTWTTTGALATARVYHSATLLPNGKVLVAGGGNSAFISSCELYDPSTGVWTPTGSLITARGATATLLNNGKVLAAGGSANGGYLASSELYDPSTGTWSTTGAMGAARTTTATLLSDGRVLVAGGFYYSFGYVYISSAEIYDPTTGTWSTTGSMSSSRESQAAALLPNGKVLEAGGGNGSVPLSSAELYDPTSSTWTATSSMGTARASCPTATLLSNGKVLVVGGNNGTSALSSVELFGCTVIFDTAGKTTSSTTKTYYSGSDTYGTLPEPACTNYTFGGWWTGTNGTGTQVLSDTPITSVSDHTVYAKWTANQSSSVPSVTNIRVAQLSSNDLEIRYDLSDIDSARLAVTVNISTNGGATWFEPAAKNLTGDAGAAWVTPGADRVIVWQGWRELPAQIFSSVKVRVFADDGPELAWFKADDCDANRTLADSSVSAFGATNVSQNTSDRTAAGLFGKALTFQSAEYAVTQGSNACAAISGDNCTIAFWGKRAVSNVHSEWFNMLGNGYNTVCYYNKDVNQMLWHWYTATGLQINAATTFPVDTWTHWAFVRSGTNFFQYKNGALVQEAHGNPSLSASEIRFGGRGGGLCQHAYTRRYENIRQGAFGNRDCCLVQRRGRHKRSPRRRQGGGRGIRGNDGLRPCFI